MGELIAIATVLCWTVSVQFFEVAAKRVGAVPVNIIRIGSALVYFSILLYCREGVLVPVNFPLHAWIYLGVSGVVGFFIGDIFLFKALVELGPRITMLVQSLAAPTAAVIGWVLLQETYLLYQWFGMFVTLAGVSLVVLEKNKGKTSAHKLHVRRISLRGVIFAVSAMVGQAGGIVISKLGMQTENGYLDPFASTQIRALAAFVCFVMLLSATNKWGGVASAIRDRKAVSCTVTGAAIGPFIGVSLSLWTLQFLSAGVASTFFSLIPICIIPFSVYLHKEHVSVRAILGAVIAVLGVYMLMP